jgi:tyramine---L-glutamate ligase
MTTVFVYEHVTAHAASGERQAPPASSLEREGRAMLDAVVADFASLPHVQVRTAAADDELGFRRLAATSTWTLVIAPETDGALETRCRWVIAAGGRLLGSSPEAVRLTADKFVLFEHFTAHQVPTPFSWQIHKGPPSYPFVCKPRDGAGSQNISLIGSPAERERYETERPPDEVMFAQEFVPGFAASAAVLVGPCAQVVLAPCAQRLSSDGHFEYLGGETPLPAPLARRAVGLAQRAVATVPGMLGYAGVDLVLGAETAGDRVIEINPRLTTSYVGLRRLARFNIAEMMLRIAEGESAPVLEWGTEAIVFDPDRPEA